MLARPERPIYGYTDDDAPYLVRIERWRARLSDTGTLDRWRFSTVSMRINLMMQMAMSSSGAFVATGFEDCVRRIAADWRAGTFKLAST